VTELLPTGQLRLAGSIASGARPCRHRSFLELGCSAMESRRRLWERPAPGTHGCGRDRVRHHLRATQHFGSLTSPNVRDTLPRNMKPRFSVWSGP
jgi:hypothetical protein